MKDIRILLFNIIKNDKLFQNLTGATIDDPRIFWQYPPIKVELTESKPAYAVYYRTGVVRLGYKIDIAQKEDQVYLTEIHSKTPELCDDIADNFMEMFREKSFQTNNYSVLYTYANISGSPQFDHSISLYNLSVQIYMTKIIKK